MTINELLALTRVLRGRVGELQRLRSEVSTTERWLMGTDREKTKEPNYDVKAVDRKVAELEKFLFKADAAIKQANATTQVQIEADVDVLLEPLI
jgi:hypothetical protein